jgi:hypothetical protein
MPVTAVQLISPVGPLTTTFFPEESLQDLTARATQYVANAVADPAIAAASPASKQDQMTLYLALAQAFDDIYLRMSAEPLQVNVTEKGNQGYSVAQITNMKERRDYYRGLYEALLPTTVEPIRNTLPGTLSVPTEVCW